MTAQSAARLAGRARGHCERRASTDPAAESVATEAAGRSVASAHADQPPPGQALTRRGRRRLRRSRHPAGRGGTRRARSAGAGVTQRSVSEVETRRRRRGCSRSAVTARVLPRERARFLAHWPPPAGMVPPDRSDNGAEGGSRAREQRQGVRDAALARDVPLGSACRWALTASA